MTPDPTTADTPRLTEAAAAALTSGTAVVRDAVRDLLPIAAAPGTAAADAADLLERGCQRHRKLGAPRRSKIGARRRLCGVR